MSSTTKFRRRGRGSVALIALLLFGSSGLRVGLSAQSAMAKTSESSSKEQSASSETISAKELSTDEEVSTLLSTLLQREKTVKEMELKLDLRAKSLDVAQQEVERRITALEAMENKLRSTLAKADSAAENDIARLTTVYENMKSPDAAALFEAMEPAFAAGFLGRMRPDAAAGIMAGLSPQAAYTISVLLAGRNAKVPKS
jgi:flagellar motility protein MotE (MotC chaperone)